MTCMQVADHVPRHWPRWRVGSTGSSTTRRYEVDAFWPSYRLIVELDSWEFDRGRRAFERDRERDAILQAAGYRVIRVTWRRLTQDPAEVAALLRRLMQLPRTAAEGRPPPTPAPPPAASAPTRHASCASRRRHAARPSARASRAGPPRERSRGAATRPPSARSVARPVR